MKMPSYVNPEVLLSNDAVDQIIKDHPSVVKRMKLYAHIAVTNAVLGEMGKVVEKERQHLSDWLDKQGYEKIAEAIREGETPTLEQPAPRDDPKHVELESRLNEALQQIEAMQTIIAGLESAPSTQTTHPKPWAVRRKDGRMHYYDTRAQARREATGDIVVDCR